MFVMGQKIAVVTNCLKEGKALLCCRGSPNVQWCLCIRICPGANSRYVVVKGDAPGAAMDLEKTRFWLYRSMVVH